MPSRSEPKQPTKPKTRTKPRGRRLKVFEATLGFYDTVVAAPSQAAALRAWGTHQNLFADGLARLAADERAIEVALANPGIPMRRAVGTQDAFALEPSGLPRIPDTPRQVVKKRSDSAARSRPKPPADRSKLDAAEAALRDVDEGRKQEEANFRREEEALARRREAAQAAYVDARKSATTAVVEARKAYRDAGGRD